ncbi:hypothetical protein [Mesorhizobium sp. CAU 1741]|uniref:hypothetical protein n=1 Tax=Mesorhizobium sp. CAU 1741 TaxID=3140366 RepID=UPI00325BFA40
MAKQSSDRARERFFFEHTWLRFSPRRNLRFLLRDDEQFLDQKEMVTRALSTWVISGRRTLCKNAIALQIVSTIGRVERIAFEEHQQRDIITDFVGRVSHMKPEFFTLAYYPIGGMTTLSKMSSLKRHREVLADASKDLDAFIELMRIFHFWQAELVDPTRFAKPSLNKAVGLIADVKAWTTFPAFSTSKLRGDLRRYMGRGALIYAASTIELGNGRTLLEAMRLHFLSFDQLQPVLDLWIARAQFVTQSLLQHVAKVADQTGRETYDPKGLNMNTLPRGDASSFPLDPPFSAEAEKAVRKQFIRDPGGRPKTRKVEQEVTPSDRAAKGLP